MTELIEPTETETPEPEEKGFGYDVYSTEKVGRETLVHIARTDGTTITFGLSKVEVYENRKDVETDGVSQKLRLESGVTFELLLDAEASAKLKRHWISTKGYS